MAIAGEVEEMVDNEVDCYWLIKNFVHHLDTKFRDSHQQLVRAGCVGDFGTVILPNIGKRLL